MAEQREPFVGVAIKYISAKGRAPIRLDSITLRMKYLLKCKRINIRHVSAFWPGSDCQVSFISPCIGWNLAL